VKALLIAAIAIDVLASLYVIGLAPIMIYGWNSSTQFNTEWVFIVLALLVAGIGGPIAGFLLRNKRPNLALALPGIPAIAVVLGCLWAIAS